MLKYLRRLFRLHLVRYALVGGVGIPINLVALAVFLYLHGVVCLAQGVEHPVGHRPQVGPLGLKLLRQPFVFVHRSHSLVSVRRRNDEQNPPDVTGRPTLVEAPGGRQRLDQNLDVQLVEGVLHESRYQNSHLSRHRPSSSEDALQQAFGRRALCG